MLTLTLRVRRAGARAGLLVGLLLAGLSGCETVEVVEEPPEAVEPVEPEPVAVVPEPEPAKGGLVVRLHADSDAQMPAQSIATVTLERDGVQHSATLSKGDRLVRFDDLEVGRYSLLATVNSNDVEVGAFSYFVDVAERMGDVTVQIDFQRADLAVEATVDRTLRRQYVGTATITSDSCPGQESADPTPSDLSLFTDGERLTLSVASFQQEPLRLSGVISPPAEPSFATGGFETATGQAGDWVVTELSAPSRAAIALAVEFNDPTRSCQWALEYAGLWEEASDSAALASNRASAAVEVTGHGQTRKATLDRGESIAQFSGLLIGPYSVSVGLRDGERMVNSQREAVTLTAEGARVQSTFATEYMLPAYDAPAKGAELALLGHRFEGKSVVTNGPPECTGSIALLDTATLSASASDGGLNLSFDNFYGRVLELTGRAEGGAGLAAASGTYRSSDGKVGSWRIAQLAAPTSLSVAMQVEFSNETDSCQATYAFAGVRQGAAEG
ncbi:MAG: hypothetical protein OXE83_12405 [Gammaproteobacteria bacterium]|nr:hypothetical protein [Gammaproteobacteria bacterium]